MNVLLFASEIKRIAPSFIMKYQVQRHAMSSFLYLRESRHAFRIINELGKRYHRLNHAGKMSSFIYNLGIILTAD